MTKQVRDTRRGGSKLPSDESLIRALDRAFSRAGIEVRREKLVRGSAFRAKSGNCWASGQRILFVDRRLAPDQQLSILVDYLIQLRIELSPQELKIFPTSIKELIASRALAANSDGDGDADVDMDRPGFDSDMLDSSNEVSADEISADETLVEVDVAEAA